MQWICFGQQFGEYGMACLMVGGEPPRILVDHHGLALQPHDDFILGFFKIDLLDSLLSFPGSEQRRFIDQIGDLSSAEPGGRAGDGGQINGTAQSSCGGVDLKNFQTAADIRQGQTDTPVKSAGSEQGGVENIGAIGGCDHDDRLVGSETIHFHE